MMWGRDLTPVPFAKHPCGALAGRGENGSWDAAEEKRGLSEGEVAFWGYSFVFAFRPSSSLTFSMEVRLLFLDFFARSDRNFINSLFWEVAFTSSAKSSLSPI